MKLRDVISGVTLVVGVGAFGLTEALSLRAGVEPLYAVIRAIVAFTAVVWLARWSANALDGFGLADQSDEGFEIGVGSRPGDDIGSKRAGASGPRRP
jgi:hypothetical protein